MCSVHRAWQTLGRVAEHTERGWRVTGCCQQLAWEPARSSSKCKYRGSVGSTECVRIWTSVCSQGPGQGETAVPFVSVWAVHLKTLAPLRPEMASVMPTLGTRYSAYLLMSGCCSDSKTRLQLSWHLFTPRISTTMSEEKNTDVC